MVLCCLILFVNSDCLIGTIQGQQYSHAFLFDTNNNTLEQNISFPNLTGNIVTATLNPYTNNLYFLLEDQIGSNLGLFSLDLCRNDSFIPVITKIMNSTSEFNSIKTMAYDILQQYICT